jgi:hypothetical protein
MSSSPNNSAAAALPRQDYDFVREVLRREIGYELGPDREYLVQSRLAPIAVAGYS